MHELSTSSQLSGIWACDRFTLVLSVQEFTSSWGFLSVAPLASTTAVLVTYSHSCKMAEYTHHDSFVPERCIAPYLPAFSVTKYIRLPCSMCWQPQNCLHNRSLDTTKSLPLTCK